MLDRFNHNLYTFLRSGEDWHLTYGINYSDAYREIAKLAEGGIPESAMHIVTHDCDRVGGQCFHRISIDISVDSEVRALKQRLHDVWLEQKRQDDERYNAMHKAALRNQESQNINWDEFP